MRIDEPAPDESAARRPDPADHTGPAAGDSPADHDSPAGSDSPARSDSPADHAGPADRGGRGADAARPGAAVSREEQVAEHARYRAVVEAAGQAAADREAWAEAVPRLRAAWADHQARYPERVRASPHTQPDGSWVGGEHRGLDPEQNTEASKAHADLADEADRYILPALRRVEAADPDRRLAGLEHLVKGEDRLKEKLADELFGKNKTVREALAEVPDAIRFTLRYHHEGYAEGVLADVDRLKAEGFDLVKLKNLWADNQYKGINSQWRNPDTGCRFEVQFHTPESLEAKELTHQAYERIRGVDVTPAERREARAFQRQVNALLSTPPGTDRIKDYPEKTDD